LHPLSLSNTQNHQHNPDYYQNPTDDNDNPGDFPCDRDDNDKERKYCQKTYWVGKGLNFFEHRQDILNQFDNPKTNVMGNGIDKCK